jgi:hypothetical protein
MVKKLRKESGSLKTCAADCCFYQQFGQAVLGEPIKRCFFRLVLPYQPVDVFVQPPFS